jgi:hypothetical protein
MIRSIGERATIANAARCSMWGTTPSHELIVEVHIGQPCSRSGPYMKL